MQIQGPDKKEKEKSTRAIKDSNLDSIAAQETRSPIYFGASKKWANYKTFIFCARVH